MMERYGFGSRVMAALLVLCLLMACVPGTALATTGDIVSGDTGILGELNTQDTIGWPIRIYDYLADGMLFESSQAQDMQIYAHNGGSYGGGQPMPMTGNICGIDYTSVAGYYQVDSDAYSGQSYTTPRYAFENWGSQTAYSVSFDADATEVERSIVQPVKDQFPMYLHLEYTGDGSSRSYGWISNFAQDEERYLSKEDIRYAVIVYRTNDTYAAEGHDALLYWSVSDSGYSGSTDISDVTDQWGWQHGTNYTGLLAAEMFHVPCSTAWSYVVVDMKTDRNGCDYGIASNWESIQQNRIAGVGMGLPLLADAEAMDISHVAYFGSSEEAERFGKKCVDFDEDPGEYLGYTIEMDHAVSGKSVTTTVTKSSGPAAPNMWNMGNGQAFTMLYASTGGGWAEDTMAGGENSWSNGYYSYQIGFNYLQQAASNGPNDVRAVARQQGYPVSDTIFCLNSYSTSPSYLYGLDYELDADGSIIGSSKRFDMRQLELGYTLYSTMHGSGLMTAGLLESGLGTFEGIDGKSYTIPQYKEDTVSYIAYLLRDTLVIPERDYWGYNYNYVMGTPSPQFGEDVDGDGKLDVAEDLDYDAHLDVAEDANGNGLLDPGEDVDGDYYLDSAEDLDGDGFLDVDEDLDGDGVLDQQDLASALRRLLGITFPANVETIRDQTCQGTVTAPLGSYAETSRKIDGGLEGRNLLIGPFLQCAPNIETVYDAAYYLLHNLFVPGSYNQVRDEYDTLVLSKATLSDGQEAYVFDSAFTTALAESATVYDKENKRIYQTGVEDRHEFYYMDGYTTPLCPFQPIDVSDATGPYAVTGTPYVREDGAENVSALGASYADRNYHYVLAANGRFTYNSEIDQRLEAAGDDDMYLFVNGELVLDLGGCHSSTDVQVVIGEAVNGAYQVMSGLEGYKAGMSDEELESLLTAQGIDGDAAKDYRRNHRLCLVDGQSYPIDFYYMERHGWTSALRLATNFQIRGAEETEEDPDILGAGSCGETLEWVMHADGVLEILGQGDMDMFGDMAEQPWADYRDQIVGVVIEDGVTSIGSYAFSVCTQLEDVIIPETVTFIGKYAFDWCDSLTSVVLPGGLTSIEEGTFRGCGGLLEVNIPSGVRSIGDTAFGSCWQLTQVDLPEGLRTIGGGAFLECSGLTEIRLPERLSSLGYLAFAGCSSVKSLKIPGSLWEVSISAFVSCSSLETVEVSEGIRSIADGAFDECPALTEIHLPESLDTVGEGAFENTGLVTVYYAGSEAQWSQIGIGARNDQLLWSQIIYGKASPQPYHLYYDDSTTNWGWLYVFYWSNTDTQMTSWPGDEMVYEGNGIYSCDVPTDAQYVIFHDGTGWEHETQELVIPGTEYVYDDGQWKQYCAHSYGAGQITTELGCETDGVRTYTCTLCGDSYTEQIPSIGHSFESVRTEPDCTVDGSVVYTCENCGDSYSEPIPAVGHSFSGGVCAACGEKDPDWAKDPGLVLSYPTLSFEDEIIYNVYYTVEDMTSVVEMGLMLLPSMMPEATMDDAIATVPGYVTNGVAYLVSSGGIPAAQMGDTIYFKVYAKLRDGSYAYSEAGGYNAKAYAGSVLSGDYPDDMKRLVVAMLAYGAEAQRYFGEDEALMDEILTQKHRALVEAYDPSMMDDVVKADASKTGGFVRDNSNFKSLYPSVSFEGAFAINYYCVPAVAVDGAMTLYWWDVETMEAVDELTVDNAVGSVEMTTAGGIWWGQVPGIAAKDMDKTYYMTCVFESEGETVTTGIIPYSLGKYCQGKAAADGDPQQDFAKATAVYGYYAKCYFTSEN